ncbi:MAG: carbohydrate kinase [Actinomycetota bacterium]|nr:carbohydrate kinase [Actinomycetota bacterium]
MIVVVGESLVDIVVDTDADSTESVGGSPLNVAVGLGRLEVPVLLLTSLGNDSRGGQVVSHLSASGAELLATETRSGRTSTAVARLDTNGRASYEFDIEWALPDQDLPACDALHVGSLGTVLEPGRNSVLDLVDQAYARDVFVSFDPNVRAGFLDDRSGTWRDIESIAERANLVKLSGEDVELLQPGADPEDIARSLLTGERTELVVVTQGERGASAYTQQTLASVPAPRTRLVDTVGAGDSFMAALLTILLESDALSAYGAGVPDDEPGLTRLLHGAVSAAALTCSRRGANPPLRSELPADWPD